MLRPALVTLSGSQPSCRINSPVAQQGASRAQDAPVCPVCDAIAARVRYHPSRTCFASSNEMMVKPGQTAVRMPRLAGSLLPTLAYRKQPREGRDNFDGSASPQLNVVSFLLGLLLLREPGVRNGGPSVWCPSLRTLTSTSLSTF